MNLNEITVTDIVNYLKGLDKKTWIKIGVGVLVAALFIYFMVIPAWFKRAQVKNKIREVKAQASTLAGLQAQEPNLQAKKLESMKLIRSAKNRLFQPGEVSLLLGQISKLADESNITIIASRPRGDVEVEFPEPFHSKYEGTFYDFTVEGKYHDVGRFVSKIESYSKLLRVELFKITPQTKKEVKTGKHLIDMSLSAVSFRQGEV